MAESEHAIFERSATLQAPFLADHFSDEAQFVSALGFPGLLELFDQALEGLHVLVREDVDLAVEAVTEGVERRDFLPSSVLGPVLCFAFSRLAWMRSSDDGMGSF